MNASEKIEDIIRELKYRYCNYMGRCKDCPYGVNCYARIPLNKIIGFLEETKKKEIIKEKIRDEIRDRVDG